MTANNLNNNTLNEVTDSLANPFSDKKDDYCNKIKSLEKEKNRLKEENDKKDSEIQRLKEERAALISKQRQYINIANNKDRYAISLENEIKYLKEEINKFQIEQNTPLTKKAVRFIKKKVKNFIK